MHCSLATASAALALLLVASGPADAQDSLLENARSTFKPIPETPPAVPGVEATADRVELGKMLYFEPRLSESHTISCNSCHIVGLGGVDMMETSLGHRWQTRRAQRADRSERGVQYRAVLGRPRQGPRTAGGRARWSTRLRWPRPTSTWSSS